MPAINIDAVYIYEVSFGASLLLSTTTAVHVETKMYLMCFKSCNNDAILHV